MADKAFMAYRALRRHARSCSFVLRAGGISIATIVEMGEFLEIGRRSKLAAS